MARNSLELRKKLMLSDFYRLSRDIAVDYSSTAASTARAVFMERYDITESTFYTLLEMSITHHLVSDKLVQSIREKILANQAEHGNNGYKSNIKYNRLEEERREYSAFLKKDIEYIATFYATHLDYTKQDVANCFGFYNSKVLDQLLKKACVELIVSDKVFNLLYNRAMEKAIDVAYTQSFFERLAQIRAEAKKVKKQKSAF